MFILDGTVPRARPSVTPPPDSPFWTAADIMTRNAGGILSAGRAVRPNQDFFMAALPRRISDVPMNEIVGTDEWFARTGGVMRSNGLAGQIFAAQTRGWTPQQRATYNQMYDNTWGALWQRIQSESSATNRYWGNVRSNYQQILSLMGPMGGSFGGNQSMTGGGGYPFGGGGGYPFSGAYGGTPYYYGQQYNLPHMNQPVMNRGVLS